jgi:hypothetical protein
MQRTIDDATTSFLLDRSTIVLLIAKGNHGRGYDKALDVTHFGRGTGVFIERANRGYVATNEHVIRPRVKRRDVPISVMVALGRGKEAAEDHVSFVSSERLFQDDGHGKALLDSDGNPVPADTKTGSDLALIALSDESFQRAKGEGKIFTSWPPICAPLQVGNGVCFRGYAAGEVDMITSVPPSIVGDGYTLFSGVAAIDQHLISVDATEDKICYGKGSPRKDRDLHGISGAGLFDTPGNLRAIVWGGEPSQNVVYACPVELLTPLFKKLDDSSDGGSPTSGCAVRGNQ